MSQEFTQALEQSFQTLADGLFSDLKSGEALSLNLNAEQSTYLRFNQAQVRQNTFVEQKSLSLQFQSENRKIEFETMISGHVETDRQVLAVLLDRAREEARVLPEDPFIVPLQNRGESRKHHPGRLPAAAEAMESIVTASRGNDLVGFYAGGPAVRAARNSAGQKHWFSTENFFMDYSLFTTNVDGENKAVKGVFSDNEWSSMKFAKILQDSLIRLNLTKRKSTTVKPGKHRTYLAPGALSEICQMFSWNAVSYSALKKGNCAFAKLHDGQKRLSPLFNLKENFKIGLCPQFNSLGDMAPEELVLIEKGELKNMLVNSRTEKEYGVPANGAEAYAEHLRSPEILPGSLAEKDVLKTLGTGLYLSNLHYLNWSDISSARLTGMTRYACFWVEGGEIVGPIKDMRFDDSLFQILGPELEALTQEQHIDPAISTYSQREIGGKKIPGALISQFSFTL